MINNPVHSSSTASQPSGEYSYATSVGPPRVRTDAGTEGSGYLTPNDSSKSLLYANRTAASEPGYAVLDPNRPGSPVERSQSPTTDGHTYATLDPNRPESPVGQAQSPTRVVGDHNYYAALDPRSLENSASVYGHKAFENGPAEQPQLPTRVVGGHTYATLDPTGIENPTFIYGHKTDQTGEIKYLEVLSDSESPEASSEPNRLHYEDLSMETLDPKHVYSGTVKDIN